MGSSYSKPASSIKQFKAGDPFEKEKQWETLYEDVLAHVIREYRGGAINFIYKYTKFAEKYSGTSEKYLKHYMTTVIPTLIRDERGIIISVVPLNEAYDYSIDFQINIFGAVGESTTYYNGEPTYEEMPSSFLENQKSWGFSYVYEGECLDYDGNLMDCYDIDY